MPDDIASLGIRIDSLQVDQARDRLERLTQSGRSAENQTSKMASSFRVANVAMAASVAASTALSAAVGVSVRNWLSYDKAIKEVRSITGQTKEEFASFRTEVLELSTAIGVDATVAARGLYEAISAGVPKENVIEFLAVASKTAVAGVTDVDTAVNGLTNVFNAFKVPVTEAEDVANKFLQTVNDGKTTFTEMAKNMADASVPMATLGGTYEELFAQIGAITSLGTPTSQAFTQVKASINALLDPSKEMSVVLERIGFSSGRAAVEQLGYAETLNKIREALNGNDAELFKAMRSSEAFNGILSTTGENAKTTAKFTDNLKDSTGNLSSAYKTNADTLGIALISVKNAATGLVEQMEGSFGIIGEFSNALRGAAELIQMFSGKNLSAETESMIAHGGAAAAMNIDAKIKEMENQASVLEASLKRNPVSTMDTLQNVHPLATLLPNESTDNVSKLKETRFEIEQLKQAYSKLSDVEKERGVILQKQTELESDINTNSVLPEKGAILQAQLNQELDLTIDKENMLLDITKLDAEVAAQILKDQENRAKEAEAKFKAEKEAAEEQAKADKSRLSLSEQLGKNRRQILEDQMKELETVKLTNGATEQQIAYADAGIEKLKEELYLLDEKGNKIEKASIVGGADGQSKPKVEQLAEANNFEPIFERPTENLFEELQKQEDAVIKSYQKRKAEILALTNVTEEERAALIMKTNQELAEAQAHFDQKRYDASLGYAADFFGNLSTIAGAFGKKGHKIAQAAAIAETTINTYKSATAAYSSLIGIPYIGPVLAPVAAGAAIAAGFANIQKIKSTEYQGAYARGGIIGGNSYEGDKLTASVNSGEMIFNRSQQKKLLDISNGDVAGDSAKGGGVQIIVQNLPGQDVDVRKSDDGKIITLAVKQAKAELAQEARQGGGTVFPAFAQSHGLKRKGS